MMDRKYLQVKFIVVNQADCYAGNNTMIRPDYALVEHKEDQGFTVYVYGPIVRKDKVLSTRNGRGIYGTFGIPLDQAPDWINDLVIRVKAMEAADAQD